MINLILFYEKIPNYTKTDIDKGNTPIEIYEICSCIRETFCLSYGIRKSNKLLLYFQEKNILVEFNGKKLRYLGPDERSQALLLNKALEKAGNNKNIRNDKWIESTPGINVRNLSTNNSFLIFLNSLNDKRFVFICDQISPYNMNFLYHTFDLPKIKKFKQLKNPEENIFLFPSNTQVLVDFLKSLVRIFPSKIEHVTLVPLNKIKAIEEKILYVNFQIDQLGRIK